jgi:phage-related protein
MSGEAFVHAVFYRDARGVEPVDEYLCQLKPEAQLAIDNQIDRLNMQSVEGPPLPFPQSSQVEGELRELRCHYGKTLYRILYRRSRNLIILLHIVEKHTGQLPEGEIEIARRRWVDAMARMNPPQRPRAFGRDAPPRRS